MTKPGESGENGVVGRARALGEKTPITLALVVVIVGCTYWLTTQLSDLRNDIKSMNDRVLILKANRDEEIKTIKETIIRLEERLHILEQRK